MKSKKIFMLVLYRKKYGLTQKQFSELVNIAHQNYIKKEKGITPFVLEEIQRIRDVLNELATKCGEKPLTADDIFLSI